MRSTALLLFTFRMYERAVWYLLAGPVARVRVFVGTGFPAESADVLVRVQFVASAFMFTVKAEFWIVAEWREVSADGR